MSDPLLGFFFFNSLLTFTIDSTVDNVKRNVIIYCQSLSSCCKITWLSLKRSNSQTETYASVKSTGTCIIG